MENIGKDFFTEKMEEMLAETGAVFVLYRETEFGYSARIIPFEQVLLKEPPQ
jgi:hypothetical protein